MFPFPDINLPCSLRAAIMEANGNPGADTIAFNVGPGGAQTFAPASPYQDIGEPL